ncbi:hypothetical protein [Halomonas organivorans]|uniref:hypothetical protein n=1 Tax=Halomonas organivorans TaxID=257772 RepID=UPI003629C22E
MGLVFKDMIDDDQDLFQALQSASVSRDEGAPLYVTAEDLQGWEKRNDITLLRKEYDRIVAETSWRDRKARSVAAKIKWIRDVLSALKLSQMRKDYFDLVDDMRSRGLDTQAVRDAANKKDPRRCSFGKTKDEAMLIGKFLAASEPENTKDVKFTNKQNRSMGCLLLSFLRGSLSIDVAAPILNLPIALPEKEKEPIRPCCLLCNKSFADRSKLTRHTRLSHVFDKPFSCPKCQHQGNIVQVSAGGSAWSSHAERYHGKDYAPHLPSKGVNEGELMPCLVCGKMFRRGNAQKTHFFLFHRHNGHLKNPSNCKICRETIQGEHRWLLHYGHHHGTLGRKRPKRKIQGSEAPIEVIAISEVKQAQTQQSSVPGTPKSEHEGFVSADEKGTAEMESLELLNEAWQESQTDETLESSWSKVPIDPELLTT